MNCPKCKSRATGRIGQGQYYCWDCSIEFEPTPAGVRVYRLEPDGIAIPESIDGSPVSGSTLTSRSQANTGLRRESR
ncbi:MAG: hypothetical protein WBL52_04635 [Bacillota bacterium]|jgi:hypothetical protein|nr:hypothetical protein [Candidatus Fermentithermobacillaceae bacterium]HOA71013.1 hypothetical protein [Bacillota bacterium]HOP70375.1 hypothetical protein [Bacillota bacterium]HPT36359.1 hypothetical protein [Bacillota bacterium]HPZ85440.1 hypothetical protein [Bacillota bacterium]